MSICRQLFQTYGTPEEISTDGGQPFTSTAFQEFLQTWGIKHRRSSVAYPQSNGRAELAVKTAKRIVNGNTDAQGSLDNDKAARAILQYRNTPIQGIGLSPAQLLLHCRLRDSIPSQPFLYKPHPEWIAAAQRREEILHKYQPCPVSICLDYAGPQVSVAVIIVTIIAVVYCCVLQSHSLL